jgi:hypothetical protein
MAMTSAILFTFERVPIVLTRISMRVSCESYFAIVMVLTSHVAEAWSVAPRQYSRIRQTAALQANQDSLPATTFWSDSRKDLVLQTNDNALVAYFQAVDPLYRHPMASYAAQATYQWAAHFVVTHNLCPWAERSVQTHGAMQIIILTYTDDIEEQLEAIAAEFHERIDSGRADPNTAILFCVVLPPPSTTSDGNSQDHWTTDFSSFYDWYLDVEDAWIDRADEDAAHVTNKVTLAPFHPQWEFASDTDDDDNSVSQSLEKQSPFPTITMVATSVIQRAGEAATRQIFDNNQETLASKPMEEWTRLYQQAVFGNELPE